MDYTVILTRFLGIVFSVYGLGILFNHKKVKAASESLGSNSALSWVVGVCQLFWGSLIIVLQQAWTNWSVMTTLAGWLIFLMGVWRLWCPCSMSKCDSNSSSSCGVIIFFGLVILVWGLLMIFYGFFGSLDGVVSSYHAVTGSVTSVTSSVSH